MTERFFRVICKPAVSGKNILHLRQIDPPLKTLKRLNIHRAVIIKESEKAPAALLIERDGITRKKHQIVDEIAKMSPRVPGYQIGLNFDIADPNDRFILEQTISALYCHGIFKAEGAYFLTMISIFQIIFFDFPEIDPRAAEMIFLSDIEPARMVGIDMGKKQRFRFFGAYAYPLAHRRKALMALISRIDGYLRVTLAYKKEIDVIFPDTAYRNR